MALPPFQGNDHSITLHETLSMSSCIDIRRCRMKQEVLVKELMAVGITQPNTSRFFNLVLLVCKKDWS